MVLGDGHSGVEREIAAFQKLVLDRVLLLSLAALLAHLATTLQLGYAERSALGQLAVFPAVLLVGVAALWRKAPTRFRQLALVLGVLTPTLTVGFRTAYLSPNALVADLMLLVLVALVIGRKAAWAVFALVMAMWLLVAWHFVAGARLPASALFDASRPTNWLRVLLTFGVVAGTCVAAATFLMNKTVDAVRRAEVLHRALTQESSARIAVLEEQRLLEEHLRQARKLEALGTLAGGVAHDFNNLLMVISCHADLADDPRLPASTQESLKEIRAASERAAALTRQLLAFGRRQVATRTAVPIDDVVNDTLNMLRRLLPSSIELDIQTGTPNCTVWSDAIELSQVVMNLCVNARDAMPDGGHLTVSTKELWHTPPQATDPRRYVRLQIRDTGIGIDAQTLERVFEPFFTTKATGAGTGLGLSTVHGIVEQLGGYTQIESEPQRGTTVSAWLPQCDPLELHAIEAEGPLASGHETILVVDDDPGARAINAKVLSQAGYQVIACDDGRQAWELYQQRSQEIALIVSDAIMPQMSGRELYERITQTYGEVPLLVCSGYTDETFAADFFDQPLRAYLAKPYGVTELLRQVRSLLERAKSEVRSETSAAQNTVATSEPGMGRAGVHRR